MGQQLTNIVWDGVALGAGEKLVLLALARVANDRTGLCHPRVGLIAELTGLKYREVQRILRRLRDLSIISTATRRNGSPMGYRLMLEALAPAPAPVANVLSVAEANGKVVRLPVHIDFRGVTRSLKTKSATVIPFVPKLVSMAPGDNHDNDLGGIRRHIAIAKTLKENKVAGLRIDKVFEWDAAGIGPRRVRRAIVVARQRGQFLEAIPFDEVCKVVDELRSNLKG